MPPPRRSTPSSARSASDPLLKAAGPEAAGLEAAVLVDGRQSQSERHPRGALLEPASRAELEHPAPVPTTAPNGVRWLPVPGWKIPWLSSGFSTRLGGVSRAYAADGASGELNLGLTPEDSRENVVANRRLLAGAVTGNGSHPLITLRQFHSNLVVIAGSEDAARERPRKGDGLLCAEPGLLLGVQTADCIPVLVADRKRRVVGAFHAGWRGTVKRIVESGIGRMRLEFGSRPADLIAAIGPGIGPCCYAVGEEVWSEFESQFAYARVLFHEVYDSNPVHRRYPTLFLNQRAPGHMRAGTGLHVDLMEANRRQLLDAGISLQSIQIVGGCTQCNRGLFFSHRGARGRTGRMMAVIGIRSGKGVAQS